MASSVDLLPARGCVYIYPETVQAGIFDVEGLPRDLGNGAYLLLDDISVKDTDIVQQKTTLMRTRILYEYGRAFGDVSISGTLLMGAVGRTAGSAAIGGLRRWFDQTRVSQNRVPVNVSIGDAAYKVALTYLAVGGTDAETNTQAFMLGGLSIPLRNTGGAS
jgi:hypothetical protein